MTFAYTDSTDPLSTMLVTARAVEPAPINFDEVRGEREVAERNRRYFWSGVLRDMQPGPFGGDAA